MYSVEQSDKSIAEGTLCGIAQILNTASVIIVKDAVNNARSVKDKVADVLTAMQALKVCGDVKYLGGAARDWNDMKLRCMQRSFAEGQITLVIPATTDALKQLNLFLQQVEQASSFQAQEAKLPLPCTPSEPTAYRTQAWTSLPLLRQCMLACRLHCWQLHVTYQL